MDKSIIERTLAAAALAQRDGRREDAVRLYGQVVAEGGEQPVALNALGVEALATGLYQQAGTLFRRAIAVDPRSADLWINLAKAMRDEGNDAGERQALEAALAIDQRHFMALVRLAELFERQGDVPGAAERWAGVLALSGMIDRRTPAIETMLDHARNLVAGQRKSLGDAMDGALREARASVPAEQRRGFDVCVDQALGRRRIFANECAGLHFPFLPAEEFFARRHFPWLAEIEAKAEEIRIELEALLAGGAEGFLPYVRMDPGTPANKWSPLDHSPDWGALHLWKAGQREDAVCARAPKTAAAIERLPLSDLPGRTPTVFFSLLQPGTHLPPHTGVSNVRAIIHLPLIVPERCTFRVGGETRAWEPGRAWAFDDTIEHEAWNESSSVRGILIFDVWNPYISVAERDLLRRFCTIADATGGQGDARLGVAD